MELVVVVLAVVSLVSLVLALAMHASVRVVLRRPVAFGGPTPPVSILKPLRGIDDGLLENLTSFAMQRYPEFEILLGAEDPADPALDVAREFQRRHPDVAITVMVTDRPFGTNPKIQVLAQLAARAKYGVFLISDSNVRVRPHFLGDTAGELADPTVALVTNLVVGAGESTLGASLENAQLNSFVIGGICAAKAIANKTCVLGKSMLFRKDALEKIGGWAAFRHVLAEDYFMGRRFESRGFKVALSAHTVTTFNESWTADRFFARHVRWGQLRRRIAPGAYVGELLVHPTPWAVALLAATAASPSFPLRAWAVGVAFFVAAMKVASDIVLSRRLRGSRTRSNPTPTAAIILVKDFAFPAVWACGAWKRNVTWRGNERRLHRHTRLSRPAPVRLAPSMARSQERTAA